jgi:two-component system sensor histidine kinase PhcS
MMYLSGDPGSGYYAGLTLCIVATAFVFHWTFREIGITLGSWCWRLSLPPRCPICCAVTIRGAGHFREQHGLHPAELRGALLWQPPASCDPPAEFAARCKVEDQREELAARNEELTETLKRLRETELQLDQSEKLASIGRLGAGIVHEINNPLNYVKSAIYLLEEEEQRRCRRRWRNR